MTMVRHLLMATNTTSVDKSLSPSAGDSKIAGDAGAIRRSKEACECFIPLAVHGDGVPIVGVGKIWSRTMTMFRFYRLVGVSDGHKTCSSTFGPSMTNSFLVTWQKVALVIGLRVRFATIALTFGKVVKRAIPIPSRMWLFGDVNRSDGAGFFVHNSFSHEKIDFVKKHKTPLDCGNDPPTQLYVFFCNKSLWGILMSQAVSTMKRYLEAQNWYLATIVTKLKLQLPPWKLAGIRP